MASQADSLLIHTDLICKNRHLCGNSRVIDLFIFQQLFHFVLKTFSIVLHNDWRTLLDKINIVQHIVKLCTEIILQMLSLFDTALHKLFCRTAECFLKPCP